MFDKFVEKGGQNYQMSNGTDTKLVNNMKVKIIMEPKHTQDMTARYVRALYGISLLEFARKMEKSA